MEDILNKINKLRALTNSNNINESQAAATLANKLIIKYQIKEIDLAARRQDDGSESIFDDAEPMYESARVITWKQQLASCLAYHYGCALWNDIAYKGSKGGRSISRYKLIGQKNDVALCKMMFKWLSKEIERVCNIECRGLGSNYSSSFYKGAVRAIHLSLQESRTKVLEEAKSKGYALAVNTFESKVDRATRYMYKKYHLINPHSSVFNSEAFERGFNIAEHVSGGLDKPFTDEG